MFNPPVDALSDSLEERIEEHIKRINERLGRSESLTEIADEVSQLNDLITPYKQRTELIDRLRDVSISPSKKKQIEAALTAQHIKFVKNRAESQRISAKSHDVLKRTEYLISQVRRRVDREAHKNSGYLLEECGFCNGVGGTAKHPCPACKGKGRVLVHQPSI